MSLINSSLIQLHLQILSLKPSTPWNPDDHANSSETSHSARHAKLLFLPKTSQLWRIVKSSLWTFSVSSYHFSAVHTRYQAKKRERGTNCMTSNNNVLSSDLVINSVFHGGSDVQHNLLHSNHSTDFTWPFSLAVSVLRVVSYFTFGKRWSLNRLGREVLRVGKFANGAEMGEFVETGCEMERNTLSSSWLCSE